MPAKDPNRRKELAAKGGAAVPAEKRSFSLNRELASAAGKKGGKSLKAEKRSFSLSRELAAAAGKKGGLKSQANMRAKREYVKQS